MRSKRINPRLLKVHRSYTAPELALTLGVHPGTVRAWQRKGLKQIDANRPAMFRGDIARAFLEKTRADRKQPCGPGRLYCFRCQVPRAPALGRVDYVPLSPVSGNLEALCEHCGGNMRRRSALAFVEAVMPGMTIRTQQGAQRLNDCPNPCPNTDLAKGAAQ